MKRAFWIWQIKETEGGDPIKIAAEAVRAGLTDVFIKVADGPYRYNITGGVDLVPYTAQALRAMGVRVWGWQYVYGNDPVGEEKVATQRIQELKLDGFIVDAEGEFKKPGWDKRAETYLSLLKQHNPAVTIAFSSFRFPNLHAEFPWAVFYQYCSINMPQVYWLQAHNAEYQTQRSFALFEQMGKLPIWPAGPAWKENGWAPTLAEIRAFETVAEKHGAPLVSFWDWQQCRRDLPELWPVAPVTPPPPLPPDPMPDDRIERIEQKVADFDKALAALEGVLTELKKILN